MSNVLAGKGTVTAEETRPNARRKFGKDLEEEPKNVEEIADTT